MSTYPLENYIGTDEVLIFRVQDRKLLEGAPIKQVGPQIVLVRPFGTHKEILISPFEIFSNPLRYPTYVVSALLYDDYEGGGDISASGVIESPRMRCLKKRYLHTVVQSIGDLTWRVTGRALHEIMHRIDIKRALKEQRLYVNGPYTRGWNVSGQFDLFLDEVLVDYKFCAAYALSLTPEEKLEWDLKTNIYSLMLEAHGHTVKHMEICALIRDWSLNKACQDKDYPKSPWIIKPVPYMDRDQLCANIEQRIKNHQEATHTRDEALMFCTDRERWVRDSNWAVIPKTIGKNGKRKAWRCYKYQTDEGNEPARLLAEEEMKKYGDKYEVIHRPGQSTRCLSYCPISARCNQWKNIGNVTEPNTEDNDAQDNA